jgi:hypothetical protein
LSRRCNLTRPKQLRPGFLLVVALGAIAAGGCGYHVAGRAAKLPADWKTIAVPAFVNRTARYRIEQRLTQAVIREMITRTRYRIVQTTESADGLLHGEVLSIDTSPVLFDATSGQVTTMLVTVRAKAELLDNHTQKPIYQTNDMVFREEYQISSDVKSFFEEQDPALERMSRDFAAQLVSGILENF